MGPGRVRGNWTNLSSIAPEQYGLPTVSEYFIWTYTIDFSSTTDSEYRFDHGDWIEFESELALGSFVIGWGCTTRDPETSDCTSGDATPFTFTGYVPEPGALLLLGTGVLLMGVSRRRRVVPS
jgi:hypothetical protein